MNIGEILRTEREKQGLSIADISRRTYIAESYLWALETEEYHRLPGAVYIKGWLRNYGDALGLSGIALVDRWNQEHQQSRRPTVTGGVRRAERTYLSAPERLEMRGRKRRSPIRKTSRSKQQRFLYGAFWALVFAGVVWTFWL